MGVSKDINDFRLNVKEIFTFIYDQSQAIFTVIFDIWRQDFQLLSDNIEDFITDMEKYHQYRNKPIDKLEKIISKVIEKMDPVEKHSPEKLLTLFKALQILTGNNNDNLLAHVSPFVKKVMEKKLKNPAEKNLSDDLLNFLNQ